MWRMTLRRVSNSPRCHFDAVASKGVVTLANAIIVLLVVPKITHASRTDLIRPVVVDAECCPLEVAPTRLAGRIDLNVRDVKIWIDTKVKTTGVARSLERSYVS